MVSPENPRNKVRVREKLHMVQMVYVYLVSEQYPWRPGFPLCSLVLAALPSALIRCWIRCGDRDAEFCHEICN